MTPAERRAQDVEAAASVLGLYLSSPAARAAAAADLIAAARREGAEQAWDEGWIARAARNQMVKADGTMPPPPAPPHRSFNPYRTDAIARGDQPQGEHPANPSESQSS